MTKDMSEEKEWLETFDEDQELIIHVFGGGE